MTAQRMAGIMGRSLGVDSMDVFMAMADTAEKDNALLAGATGCGQLVFTPEGGTACPRLSVQAQAADRRADGQAPSAEPIINLAGVIGVAPALSSGGDPRLTGLRRGLPSFPGKLCYEHTGGRYERD